MASFTYRSYSVPYYKGHLHFFQASLALVPITCLNSFLSSLSLSDTETPRLLVHASNGRPSMNPSARARSWKGMKPEINIRHSQTKGGIPAVLVESLRTSKNGAQPQMVFSDAPVHHWKSFLNRKTNNKVFSEIPMFPSCDFGQT